MASHTGGRWEIRPAPYGYDVMSVPPLVNGEYQRPMQWIASITVPLSDNRYIDTYPPRRECDANAALLVAAPEMLEALKWLIAEHQNDLPLGRAMDNASTVVAKAEVTSPLPA